MKRVIDSSAAFKWVVAETDSDKAIRLRDDFRSFRVDRIRQPRMTEPFETEPSKSLETFLARMRVT